MKKTIFLIIILLFITQIIFTNPIVDILRTIENKLNEARKIIEEQRTQLWEELIEELKKHNTEEWPQEDYINYFKMYHETLNIVEKEYSKFWVLGWELLLE